MLKVFGRGRSTHPLLDEKERVRVLQDIAALESHRALGELSRWLRSVTGDDGIRDESRAEIVVALHATGRTPVRMLAREYLATARLTKQQEEHLWGGIHGFYSAASAALMRAAVGFAPDAGKAAAQKGRVVPLAVKALRALGAQLKWEHMRYGPVDPAIWANLARLYGRLDAAGIARTAVREYAGSPSRTTSEQEFVRVAMLAVCSLGSLLPAQIEVADRLAARFARGFHITTDPDAEMPYQIDVENGAPPARRMGAVAEGPGVRYFGADRAYDRLLAIREEIAANGEVPEELVSGAPTSTETVLEVIDHLAHYWTPNLASRKYPRHGIKSRLTVAWGFDGVIDALDPQSSLSFEKNPMESWIVENASAGGVGALVPSIPGEWVQVGCLVAMRPEGGRRWLLGTVKRLTRIDDSSAQVGIQTLARAPDAVEFRLQSGNATSLTTESGVLLDPGYTEAEVPVILRSGIGEPGRTLVLEREGRRTQLLPIAVSARGPGYEIVRCRQLVRTT
jgi:cyclic-di-GMP-binding protein